MYMDRLKLLTDRAPRSLEVQLWEMPPVGDKNCHLNRTWWSAQLDHLFVNKLNFPARKSQHLDLLLHHTGDLKTMWACKSGALKMQIWLMESKEKFQNSSTSLSIVNMSYFKISEWKFIYTLNCIWNNTEELRFKGTLPQINSLNSHLWEEWRWLSLWSNDNSTCTYSILYFPKQRICINLTCRVCPVLGMYSKYHFQISQTEKLRQMLNDCHWVLVRDLSGTRFPVQDLFLLVLSLWQEMGSKNGTIPIAKFPVSLLCARHCAKHFRGPLIFP